MGRRLLRQVVTAGGKPIFPSHATVMARVKEDGIDERIIKVVEQDRVCYRCTACGYTTGRTFNVARHYVRKHTKLQTPKTCTRCGQNFKTKGDFYEHRNECQDGFVPRPSKKSWLMVSVKEEVEDADICNALEIKAEPDSCEELDVEEESNACDEIDAEGESDACDESDVKRTSESCDGLDIKRGIRLLNEEELLKFETEDSLSPSFLEGPELYLGMDIEYNQEESILHIHDDSILPSWALDQDDEKSNENLYEQNHETLKQSSQGFNISHSFDITDS